MAPPALNIAAALGRRMRQVPSGCWEWFGCIQSNGYGRMTFRYKTDYTHRWALKSVGIDIPIGMDACHKCDNRRCINPDHLFLGTRLEKMRDCKKKGRIAVGSMLNDRKGNATAVAKLTWDQVRKIRRERPRGAMARESAASLGVTVDNIRKIIAGITWKEENGRIA